MLICGTRALPQLCKLKDKLQGELAADCIGGIRLRLQELQAEDEQAQKIRAEMRSDELKQRTSTGFCIIKECPHVSEIIRTELIGSHHDDSLAGH